MSGKRILDTTETAWILAGLRVLQDEILSGDDDHPALQMTIVDEGHSLPTLEDLDDLCERINCEEVTL
jgi:hypothetical protein